jgi:hypothetical protein
LGVGFCKGPTPIFSTMTKKASPKDVLAATQHILALATPVPEHQVPLVAADFKIAIRTARALLREHGKLLTNKAAKRALGEESMAARRRKIKVRQRLATFMEPE